MSTKRHCTPVALGYLLVAACLVVFLGWNSAIAQAYSIPAEQLDRKLVYFGAPSAFDKPAEVDYERVMRATPEFEEIQSKNIERGTGRYWILLSRASDRVGRLVSTIGNESEYDLIASSGYLGSLDPEIPAEDITDTLLEALQASAK
jgi:hypothetical protein